MKFNILITAFLFVIMITKNSAAAYLAIGQINGTVCKGFVIKLCGPERIDAEEGSDGRIVAIQTYFDDVQEYVPSNQNINIGRCGFDDTKSWPTYQLQTDGSYKRITADYIRFKCRKK